jgi:hypothetical protein
MSISRAAPTGALRRAWLGLLCAALVGASTHVFAQGNNQGNFFNARAVGGVLINPQGMITNATVTDLKDFQKALADWLKEVPEGLDRATDTRRISLRRLDETIRECVEAGRDLPESALYLGGLLKIDYIVACPEHNDVVLVGPGEGWRTDARGAVVGQASGLPVMLLDDLVVALRSAFDPRPTVISCSIDPSPEGIQRMTAYTRRLRNIGNPELAAKGIEQQLGPQQVSVTGVPDSSHYARVMVAADYRMKRIGMSLERAPVAGLPGFMDLMRSGSAMKNMLPRWWLAPDYQPLVRDADGLAWHIRGSSVKAMAEADFLGDGGVQRGAGRADPLSQKWADIMTDRYQDLSKADPVFGQLRNCMDLAVVGALLAKQNLLQRANLSLPMLLSNQDGYVAMALNAPRQVPTQAKPVRRNRGWLMAAGGVQINPWEIVDRNEEGVVPETVQSYAALEKSAQWWAN